MARKLTIHDIARLAGVSKSTVSCYLAYSVLVELEKPGWSVPEDMAVVGFDDVVLPLQGRFSLTTMRQPFHEIGQCTAEMLLALLDPRFVPLRNWWEFAFPSQPEERTRASAHNWPSCRIPLPLPLTVRNSWGSRRQPPSQNTS